jgi:ribonuclease VapC
MTGVVTIETSAIIAILTLEAESETLMDQLIKAESISCPASCIVEAVVVLTRRTDAGVTKAHADVLGLLQQLGAFIAPLDEPAVHQALDGYSKYGKGTGKSPAVLNFGDCLSYGVTKAASGKLLYTGGDFAQTDLGMTDLD